MSEEIEKRKPGRPKKEPAIPAVNDDGSGERLEMSSSGTELQSAMIDLNALYRRVINDRKLGLGNIYNLNEYNPFLQNQRLKMLNTSPGKMTRENLIKSLSDPQDNELALRAQGWVTSSQQYMYYKILRMAADIPLFKWYVTPELMDESDYKKDKFIKEDKYVNEWMTAFDPVNTLKRVSLEVKREGKATYVIRNGITNVYGDKKVNYATWQKLPSNYVKLVKIGSHGYIASFNMLIFMNPAFSPKQYPKFMQDIWADMIESGVVSVGDDGYNFNAGMASEYRYEYSGENKAETLYGDVEILSTRRAKKLGMSNSSYMFWVQLPQELCYTFCSDSSNVWAIPDTSGLLLSLDELADYDTLQGLIDSTPLSSVLTAEADMINDPNPGQDQTSLNPETIWGLQDKFNELTSTNLEAFFAPLKNFKLLSLPSQPNGSEISSNATKNVITRAGLGGLMTTTDKPSVSQVKAAQMLAESECDFVTKQFESVLNMTINDLIGCEYKWKLHIWGNIFTFSDEISRDKELFVAGATFVLPKIASAYGMNIRDVKATSSYIDSLDVYDSFRTITQANQEKMKEDGSESTGSVGRPTKSDDEIDNDNTAASKESGLDTKDTREYSSSMEVFENE